MYWLRRRCVINGDNDNDGDDDFSCCKGKKKVEKLSENLVIFKSYINCVLFAFMYAIVIPR